VLGLVESLGVGPVVVAGYDVGSGVAQAAARTRPDLLRALVLLSPLPGAGERGVVSTGGSN
jgi:pimeloyl-ACP methyl ester carboxylesterase